jgi:hypothetical protein
VKILPKNQDVCSVLRCASIFASSISSWLGRTQSCLRISLPLDLRAPRHRIVIMLATICKSSDDDIHEFLMLIYFIPSSIFINTEKTGSHRLSTSKYCPLTVMDSRWDSMVSPFSEPFRPPKGICALISPSRVFLWLSQMKMVHHRHRKRHVCLDPRYQLVLKPKI